MHRLIWPLFALVGGVLWGLCFSPEGFRWAPWVALAPMVLLLERPGAVRLGFLFGFASWVTAIPWIAPTLMTFGGLSPWLAWPLLLLLSAYLGAYGGLFALLARPIWQRGSVTWVMIGLPAVWVALEWVRAWMISGFPWNLAAYAWIESPGALEAAGWVGAYGVSFVAVWANTGLALALARRRWSIAAWALLVPLTVLATADRLERRVDIEPAGRPIAVRVLQPNIPNLAVWDGEEVRRNYTRLITQSHRACSDPGTLLIWPESAAWPFVVGRDPQLDADLAALNAKGCTVLLNSVRRDGDAAYNVAYLISSSGSEWYAKRHLVPWGEYVPLRRLLPFVGTLARNAGDFTAGREARLLPFADERLGAAICFEVVFPAEVAETVAEGATLLVSLTNDDWYGPTAAPWQHLRAARFRAAEMRRPMLRAAITGVSAIVAPDGSLVEIAGPGEEAILSSSLSGRRDRSPYLRAGGLLPGGFVVLAAFAIFWCRRSGRDSAVSPPTRHA